MSSIQYVSKVSHISLSGVRPTLNAACLDMEMLLWFWGRNWLYWPYPILKSRHVLQLLKALNNMFLKNEWIEVKEPV